MGWDFLNYIIEDFQCLNLTCENIYSKFGYFSEDVHCKNLYASENIYGNLNGNASSADKLSNPREFSIEGDAVSNIPNPKFDGTSNLSLNVKVVAIQNITTQVITYGGISTLKLNAGFQANRVFNAVYNDLAECFPTYMELQQTQDWEIYNKYKNHIVEISKDGKLQLSQEYSDNVIGVVSDSYGYLLYGNDEDIMKGLKVPVGLSGTVWVYYGNDISECNIGDLVFSGSNGKAIILPKNCKKYEYIGKIIGKIIDINREEYKVKIIITLI